VSSTSLGMPVRMHRTATLTTRGSEEILCRKGKSLNHLMNAGAVTKSGNQIVE
jgi:hypothetical protein